MKPLNITAVLDGRPGHEKQTKGVIKALTELTPVNVKYVEIDSVFISDIKAWSAALGSLLNKKPIDDKKVDIIIGTGSHTHPHVIRLGKKYAAKKSICMSPAPGMLKFFDLCFVPEHDGINPRENIFFTTGPPNVSENLKCHEPDKGLILLGGIDRKSHEWNSEKIFYYVKSIITKDSTIKWTISTSPRTPEDIEKLLIDYAEGKEGINFFKYSKTPRGWVEKEYSINSNVWVTADSMSMVYEALSAGCSVGIIPIEWKNKNGKFARSEKNLVSRNIVTPYEKWLSERRLARGSKALNEAKRCAEEVLRKWWPERLL